jgi:hypothetical protein
MLEPEFLGREIVMREAFLRPGTESTRRAQRKKCWSMRTYVDCASRRKLRIVTSLDEGCGEPRGLPVWLGKPGRAVGEAQLKILIADQRLSRSLAE